MATYGVDVRLSLKDAETVKRGLEQLGAEGQKALARIERAGPPASKGLLAVNAASQELQAGLQGLGSRAGAIGTVLGSLGPAGVAAAAGIGAAVAGIAVALAQTRQALADLDDIGDKAAKLGLTANQFVQWRAVFRENGVEAAEFEQAIGKLNIAIGDLATKGGAASKDLQAAFATLGVSVTDAEGHVKSTERVALELADALAKVEDPTVRAALAQDILGRGSAAMAQALAQGSAKLQEQRKHLEEWGLVLDENLAQKAGALNDRLETMSEIVSLNLKQALVDLGPALIEIAQGFASAARWVAELIDRFRAIESQSLLGLRQRLQEINEELAQPDAALERRQKGFLDMSSRAALARHQKRLEDKAKIEQRIAKIEESGVRAPTPPPAYRDPVAERKAQEEAEKKRQSEREKALAIDEAYRAREADRLEDEQKKIDQLLEQDKDRRAQALQYLQRLQEETAKATGDEIAAIQLKRDHEITALGDKLLSEEQLAEAKVLIHQRADAEIADAQRRALEAQQKAGREAMVVFEDIGRTATRIFADMLASGEFTAQGLLQAFQRLATDLALQQILGGFSDKGKEGSGLLGLLETYGPKIASTVGGWFGGGTDYVGQMQRGEIATYFHGGGVVGSDAPPARSLPAALFAAAPRFHDGLRPDEFPAVLQRGEGVFTPSQMAALGRVNVTVINNAGAPIDVAQRQTDRGIDLEVTVDRLVTKLARTSGTGLNAAIRQPAPVIGR